MAVGRAQDANQLLRLVCGVLSGLRGYRELLCGARVTLQRGAAVVCGLVLGLAVYDVGVNDFNVGVGVGLLGLYGGAIVWGRRVYHLGHVDRNGYVRERAEHEVGDRVCQGGLPCNGLAQRGKRVLEVLIRLRGPIAQPVIGEGGLIGEAKQRRVNVLSEGLYNGRGLGVRDLAQLFSEGLYTVVKTARTAGIGEGGVEHGGPYLRYAS